MYSRPYLYTLFQQQKYYCFVFHKLIKGGFSHFILFVFFQSWHLKKTFYLIYIMKRNTEEGGELTDSVTSRARSNLKSAEWSIARRGQLEIWLRPTWLDLARLGMKLHKVHFTVKFSEAEAEENLAESAPSAISSQCQQRASQVTQGAAEGYLAVSELTLEASR